MCIQQSMHLLRRGRGRWLRSVKCFVSRTLPTISGRLPTSQLGMRTNRVLRLKCERSFITTSDVTDRVESRTSCVNMTDALVLAALKMAIRSRSPQPGLIHHSDRGGQYVSNEYKQILLRAAMRSSMSRADNCYDNAFAESCFGTIKNELQMTEYQNYQDAKRQLAEFIRYYNFERTHSSIGYLTPHQFELNICSKK